MSSKRDWLIGLCRRAADVFMQDAGDQALIGQAFLGGALLEQLKIGGRQSNIDSGVLAHVAPGGFHGVFLAIA